MKKRSLKEISKEEAKSLLQKYEKELIEARHQHEIKPQDNPMKIRNLKKTIARLKTIIREFELGLRK